MRRLDFQTNLLKNPVSGDTPATDLARRWRNRVYYSNNWVKLYLPTTLSVAYVALFCALWLSLREKYIWDENRLFERIGLVAMFIFPLIIRVHLGCLPAMVVCGDAKYNIIKYYRDSLFSGPDVWKAMFFSAFNLGALPAASASVAIYILYLWMMDIYPAPVDLVIPAIAIFIGYFILELVLSGLGFLGAIIHKSKTAVIIGVLIPFLWIIPMLSNFAWAALVEHFTTYPSVPLAPHVFTYFSSFENLVVFYGGVNYDPDIPAQTDLVKLLWLFKVPLIWCVVVWAINWSILSLRIGFPEKPDFPE